MKRARTVAIWALALALFAGNEWTEQRAQARAEARLGRDVAAVEAAARRTTYDEVSRAWTDLKLDRGTRLFDIKARVPVRWGITYEDEGAIILVYRSEGTCIDLLVRPTANTVRTREC